MDFSRMRDNLNGVIRELDTIVLDAAMGSKELIADLNTSQLEDGKTREDKSIIPKYQSKAYANFKKSIGAKPAKFTPDLKLTGDFYSGFYAEKKEDFIQVYSNDEKAFDLDRKYDKLFGLTENNKSFFNKEITPTVQKKVRDELLKS